MHLWMLWELNCHTSDLPVHSLLPTMLTMVLRPLSPWPRAPRPWDLRCLSSCPTTFCAADVNFEICRRRGAFIVVANAQAPREKSLG